MKYKLIVIMLIISLGVSAQTYVDEFTDDADVQRETGVAIAMAEYGTSFGGFISWPVAKTLHFGIGLDAYFLRDTGEFEFYDPYYGQYFQIGKENNVYIFNLTVGIKKRFFGDVMDESLRPFLTAGIGPVYGMNFPEFSRDPEGNKNYDQFAWTLGGYAGLGADISTTGSFFVSTRIHYRVIPFPEEIGERKNQSMVELRFEVGKRF